MTIWSGLASEFQAPEENKKIPRNNDAGKEADGGQKASRHGSVKRHLEDELNRNRKTGLKEFDWRETLPISFILLVCSLTIAEYGIYRFVDGQAFTGLKFIGYSILVFSGCFDPMNYLWLCLPFTFSKVVKPPRYARFTLPLIIIGGIFIIIPSTNRYYTIQWKAIW